MSWKAPDDGERRELRKRLLDGNRAEEPIDLIALNAATSGFAILEEVEGQPTWWWKKLDEHVTEQQMAQFPPSATGVYQDRDVAERHADEFRAKRAARVERDKRKRKNKTLPATYTVIEIAPWARAYMLQRRSART